MIALLLAFADPQLVETGVGRFAVYADVASIERHGDLARMRELQVTEAGFKVGDVTYVGGWSRWVFDCRARTADRLDFASLREDGTEGPATPDAATLFREGQALYVSRCATCHGLHGEGDYGPRIEASTVVADSQQIIMQMFVGTEDGMSPQFYRELSDREIAATATFVRGALGNSFGPVFPNEVAGLR